MTITINEQKRNELLKREEIKGFSPSFKTPNFDEIRTELASLVKKPAENVFVKKSSQVNIAIGTMSMKSKNATDDQSISLRNVTRHRRAFMTVFYRTGARF